MKNFLKKLKKYLGVGLVILIIIAFLIAPALSSAAETKSSDGKVEITKEVTENLYLSGDEVDLDAPVDGDVYIAGGKVQVNKLIRGNLYVMGGEVTVNGAVEKSIIVLGGEVNIDNSAIGRNIYLASGEATVKSNVNEDIIVASGKISFDGQVQDLTIASGEASISGTVNGDLIASTGNIDLNDLSITRDAIVSSPEQDIDNVSVGGDLSLNDSSINRSNNADRYDVQGDLKFLTQEEINANFIGIDGEGLFESIDIFGSLTLGVMKYVYGLLSTFLLAAAFLFLAPIKIMRFSRRVQTGREFAKSSVYGLAAFPILGGIAIFLSLTIVGIKVAYVLVLLALLTLAISKVIASYAIAQRVIEYTDRFENKYLQMLIGVFIYVTLTAIPVIGDLASLAITLAVVGGIIRSKRDLLMRRRELLQELPKKK